VGDNFFGRKRSLGGNDWKAGRMISPPRGKEPNKTSRQAKLESVNHLFFREAAGGGGVLLGGSGWEGKGPSAFDTIVHLGKRGRGNGFFETRRRRRAVKVFLSGAGRGGGA